MPPSTDSAFYGVYLLNSRAVPNSKRTYIGFTVDPRRRLRQHNGELASGAWKTHRHRPWDMLLVVHGFESHSEALAFEWAWQNPLRSKNARDAVAALAGRGAGTAAAGARGRVRALFAMLNAPAWRDMPLTVTVLSSAHEQLVAAALPADEAARGLPRGMRLETAPVETLVVGRVVVPAGAAAVAGDEGEQLLERDPESSEGEGEDGDGEGGGEESRLCSVCSLPIEPGTDFIPCAASASSSSSASTSCRARSHPECLADRFLLHDSSGGGVIPTSGKCPACGGASSWLDCLQRLEATKPFSSSPSSSRSRSSPAKRRPPKSTAVAADSTPEKQQKSSRSPRRRRRRAARAVPKATPEELEAFAVAARENAPPAPAAAAATAAIATATAAAPRGARVSPSKRPREKPLLEPANGEEPILIGSSSSEEDEGRGGGGRAAPAVAAPAASSLLLSPLASRLAGLSPPSSLSAGKLRGGARPGEWPPRGHQQQLLQQQQQRGGRARALHVSSSSSSSFAPALAPARLHLPRILQPSPAVAAAAALASSVAAAASRGRFSSSARAARALRGLMLF